MKTYIMKITNPMKSQYRGTVPPPPPTPLTNVLNSGIISAIFGV